MEDVKDKGIYFNIKNCPQGTFARFHKYCEEVSKEAGISYASYPLGLKSLLDNVNPIGQEKVEEKIETFGGKK